MTNPDHEELTKLRRQRDEAYERAAKVALAHVSEPGLSDNPAYIHFEPSDMMAQKIAAAIRRLASSDGGVNGEPEPVAWRWRYDGEYTWSLRKDRPIHADDRDVICEPLYTAPSADAGMREALQEAYIAGAIAVHNEWLAAFKRGEGPPRGDPDFSEAASDYAALTAAALRAIAAQRGQS